MGAEAAALIAQGIGAGASLGSSIWSGRTNIELARQQAKFQLAMVNAQNKYNSPENQIARYQAAGLNPALIYGTGTSSAGNQSTIAKYDAPRVEYADVGGMIGGAVQSYMSAMLQKAELNLKHQEFENLKEMQFNIRADRHSKDIENMYKSWLTGFDPGLVTMPGEMDKVADSLRAHQANSQLMSIEALTEYRNTAKAYIEVQTQVERLKKDEKQFFIDNIQPLMRDIMEKRRDGLDTSNEILKLQRKFFTADKIAGYSKELINAIGQFISPIKIGGGPKIGPYQPAPSWYGSPFYPSESYVPGL